MIGDDDRRKIKVQFVSAVALLVWFNLQTPFSQLIGFETEDDL